MNFKKVFFYLLAGILAGCVPVMSLNPLYDDKTLVFDENLLGTFEGDNVTWEFTRAKDPNVYQLIYTAVSKDDPNVVRGNFDVRLVKLDSRLFLDIYPKEAPWEDEKELSRLTWPFNFFLTIPVHTFAKVEISELQLKICLTDDDEFKKIVEAEPNAVGHQFVDGTPVLTSSTKDIQSFVRKYADDDRLFPNESILARKSATMQDDKQMETEAADSNEKPL